MCMFSIGILIISIVLISWNMFTFTYFSCLCSVPARFDNPDRNYTVHRGHNVTLSCQAIGDKPLSVSWNVRNTTMGVGNFDR